MANQIYISSLLPVQFYELDLESLPQYESRFMDDYRLSEQLKAWQTSVEYKQKWTIHDAIKLQFESNFDPIQVQLIDCNYNASITHNAVQRRKNKYMEGFYVYEDTLSLAAVDPGTYFILLTLANTKKMISEPMEISNSLPNSLLVEYNNSTYHGDLLFETGIDLSFRMEAIIRGFEPSSERTSYRDQRLNPTVLKSVPFRAWDLFVGKDYGVPDWVGNKINWIFSCDNVRIDGKPYGVLDDSKIEAVEIDPVYPLRAYSLKIQEGYNRASKLIGVETDPNKRLIVSLAIDSTVFGDLSEQSGNNIISINAVE